MDAPAIPTDAVKIAMTDLSLFPIPAIAEMTTPYTFMLAATYMTEMLTAMCCKAIGTPSRMIIFRIVP